LEGHSLQVLGRLRRHGGLELLVVLPDGSKRLIPAAWTDLQAGNDRVAAAATLGALGDLLAACALVSALSARDTDEQAARQPPCKEDRRAACAAQSAAGAGSGAIPDASRPASRTAGRGRDRAAGRSDRQDRDRRGGGR
jgi:hypothetical protein